ncbi:MAG TPA: cell division protein FtsZ [Synergistales bacterium]|nr:cell division protein FtsZ [Synergistales bacterium]
MEKMFKVIEHSRVHHENIKVLGVGGGGGNALNHIVRSGVKGVEFIAANTDMASLGLSEATTKLVLGRELTKGLGAGADPEIGYNAAKESFDEIREIVSGADMVFLTAGMGGGTGTGATPVLAEIAKESGALVVAVVTQPFSFEGKKRFKQAVEGTGLLKEKVDALIIIENDKLLEISDRNTGLTDAFQLADEVLRQAVQGVTDLILCPGLVNVDFADVRTVMKNAGAAIMGIGEAQGDNRAVLASQAAINSPLMSTPMDGAKGVLFNVTGGNDVGIYEIQEAARVINEAADEDATIIWGHTIDPEMEDRIKITVIATGFNAGMNAGKFKTISSKNITGQKLRTRVELEESEVISPQEEEDLFKINGVPSNKFDIPTYIRKTGKK